jgi:hypothetical protein
MRRFGLVLAAAALVGAANTAEAQLSMQMGNGWNATFAGNVNAFWVYGNGGDSYSDVNGIGTGLLPAFFTFDAKGKEGETNLGVHIGFAPQVSSGNNVASFFGSQAAGAQIDMRQVYATVGGDWGQILFGKELGVFQRQNLLTDITLFGVGPNGLGRGTGLGRIGYGYLYTDFRGQFTYSTPAGKTSQFTFGVFEPISFGPYDYGSTPRFEAEMVISPKFGEASNLTFFASGALQSGKDQDADESKTALGVSGGAKLTFSGLEVMGSGFFASGMGTVFMGDSYLGDGIVDQGVLGNGDLQDSYGFIVQAQYTLPSKKFSLGGSYGMNKSSDVDTAGNDVSQESFTFIGTYHWTKSLRVVAEFTNYTPLFSFDGADSINQFAAGMMLFY